MPSIPIGVLGVISGTVMLAAVACILGLRRVARRIQGELPSPHRDTLERRETALFYTAWILTGLAGVPLGYGTYQVLMQLAHRWELVVGAGAIGTIALVYVRHLRKLLTISGRDHRWWPFVRVALNALAATAFASVVADLSINHKLTHEDVNKVLESATSSEK